MVFVALNGAHVVAQGSGLYWGKTLCVAFASDTHHALVMGLRRNM